MSIAAIRTSETEVHVGDTIYGFARKDEADAFMRCVAHEVVERCRERYESVSARSAQPDVKPDDPDRGSTISPSLGGMP